ALHQAFEKAFAGESQYLPVYPIKVNQQASIVEHLLQYPAAHEGRPVGLEAGSKAELSAVIGVAPKGTRVICNGYKDREYMQLALAGLAIGLDLTIVLEKADELDLVLEQAAELGVEPQLGLRVRMACMNGGKWQNTGGAKSKFGLSAAQLLPMLERLKQQDKLHWVRLLHTHLGSQVSDLADLEDGLSELLQYYVQLRQFGCEIDDLDIGGGLAVDYEGGASAHYYSMNYGLDDYASLIANLMREHAEQHVLPMPRLITEAGRAMAAHHAVLVVDVTGYEPDSEMHQLGGGQNTSQTLQRALQNIHDQFVAGDMNLAQRAEAETAARAASLNCHESRSVDKYFCNFSVFQSLPDVWAINQVFPIVPLQRLHEAPSREGVLVDLSCDSDGRIDDYAVEGEVRHSLPLHPIKAGERYYLGIFLVGAYQEILGDIHNLFGDTNAVNVLLDEQAPSGYRLLAPEHGDRADQLLEHVHFDVDRLRAGYRSKAASADLTGSTRQRLLHILESGLTGYTYLEE
ncbi:MAG: arginine decarboxylase, partial [Gammaproteobacteria bacterium]|nr:arginine decarboxylase [Gammaproteobacteria bacterium]